MDFISRRGLIGKPPALGAGHHASSSLAVSTEVDAMFLQSLLVFFAVAIIDVFWAKYSIAVREFNAIQGGIFSAVIILFGGYTTRAYVHDGLLIIPAALGAFAGTYATIFYHKSKLCIQTK